MVRGRDETLWNHTAALAAVVINCHRVKGAAVRADQIHPYRGGAAKGGRRIAITPANIELLRRVFVDRGRQRVMRRGGAGSGSDRSPTPGEKP